MNPVSGALKTCMCAVALLLAGCTAAPPASVVPDLSFSNIAPVMVHAAKVQVVDNFHSPLMLPNVEYLFRQPPDAAVTTMLREKVRADGTQGRILRIYVDDAAVKAKVLTQDDGIFGVLKPEPGVRYAAHVALRFELVQADAPDIVIGRARIVSDRTLTLAHGVTPQERDMAFFEMDEALMRDIGANLQTTVKKTFGAP